jgi:phenylpropionate dioxygenase-like ring-hydroxylating dioxygenase large terminal subunit
VHDLKLAARFTTLTPANWKNIVDNYLECYHFQFAGVRVVKRAASFRSCTSGQASNTLSCRPGSLEEYAGFVFINMNPQAESVETQLPGLQDKVLEAAPFRYRNSPRFRSCGRGRDCRQA